MADFLFHKVSEKEKEDIKKQAKRIMDDFSNTLKGTSKLSKVKGVNEALIERAEGERDESGGDCNDLDRKIMFDNAPETRGDFIMGEKGGW